MAATEQAVFITIFSVMLIMLLLSSGVTGLIISHVHSMLVTSVQISRRVERGRELIAIGH